MQPNPFQQAQQAPAPEQHAAANPFAQQAQAPAAGNPYAGAAQQVQQQAHPVQQAAASAPAPAANPFAQQQVQQAAPAYQQQAPAAQVQQQYAPVAGPSGPPPALGPVSNAPAPVVGDGKGATLPDMYGRLVVMFPFKLERVMRRPEHITAEQRAAGNTEQDRMTVTVVVLDDGQGGFSPIAYGGKPYALGGTPHTDSAPLPYLRRGMWINQTRLISQLTASLPAPGGWPSPVCGRIVKTGPESNAPWYLAAATEADLNLVNTYMGLVASGQYPHPLG